MGMHLRLAPGVPNSPFSNAKMDFIVLVGYGLRPP